MRILPESFSLRGSVIFAVLVPLLVVSGVAELRDVGRRTLYRKLEGSEDSPSAVSRPGRARVYERPS